MDSASPDKHLRARSVLLGTLFALGCAACSPNVRPESSTAPAPAAAAAAAKPQVAALAPAEARAQLYCKFVVEELERRHMPTELALLPIVESAYDPFAYSHGRAAGLWQFIPGTGRRYSLKLNWWYDGRRDVVESTRAALDY